MATLQKNSNIKKNPVSWFRNSFNGDPDPAFYFNADMDWNPGWQTIMDPCGSGSGSWSDLKVKKRENFSLKNILAAGNR
jgi:hypothetical protein